MTKQVLFIAVLLALLVASMFTADAIAGTNGNQIMFSINGDTIQYLVIDGTNQNNQETSWQWADAWFNNWSTGAYVLTTKDWWWKGDVQLSFYGTKTGEGFCHIENLKISPNSDYTVVTYLPEIDTCSGDAGNSSTPTWVRLVLEYFLGDYTTTFYDATNTAYSTFECRYYIAETLAKGETTLNIKTFWACKGAAADTLTWLFKIFNVKVQ